MIDPSNNNSFIPKHGPAKFKRANVAKQVYVFSIISYILMFSSLLSAGGIYLYSKYFVEKQRDEKVVELDTAIRVFSEADMQEVLDFDRRLQQASDKFESSIALGTLFKAFEEATIEAVQIDNLKVERDNTNDEVLALEATLQTDSIDSAIFQRGVYKSNELVGSVVITGLDVEGADENQSDANLSQVITTEFIVPVSDVPYMGSRLRFVDGVGNPSYSTEESTQAEDVEESTGLENANNTALDNQENI